VPPAPYECEIEDAPVVEFPSRSGCKGSRRCSQVFAGGKPAICQRAQLRQSFTKAYRPRTNGKAERFIRTLLREWAYRRFCPSSAKRRSALPRWLHYYKFHRLHWSLGYKPPASRVNNLLSLDS
jgi:transposase InsO family protein